MCQVFRRGVYTGLVAWVHKRFEALRRQFLVSPLEPWFFFVLVGSG